VALDKTRLHQQYSDLLMKGIVPFWLTHGVDRTHGGVLSCMQEDGTPIGSDKFIWSQARFVWTCAALYNRIERRQEFLDRAQETVHFLLAHGRDEEGRFVYRTTADGRQVEGATSIYSDCFVVYGLNELFRATGEASLLELAVQVFRAIAHRVEQPEFRETAPYVLPPNRRNHGVPMILTSVADELAQTTGDPSLEAAARDYAGRVMDRFVSPERGCLIEFLDRDYRPVPAPEGTFVMPGHAIESMWFIIHWARRVGENEVIARALEVIRWHVEKGWDPEYGGLFLGVDSEGGVPFQAHSEKKLWWPHVEALYALLLAHDLTGDVWYADWYSRVHEWSFAHFPMPEIGEWRQRLDRQGRPVTEVVALPVKDPFHLPRAVILILELLGGIRG
jgi:N-acylglucosamine 2-epimerase